MEGGRAIERKVITALFCDVLGSTELKLGDADGGVQALRQARDIASYLRSPPLLATIDRAISQADESASVPV